MPVRSAKCVNCVRSVIVPSSRSILSLENCHACLVSHACVNVCQKSSDALCHRWLILSMRSLSAERISSDRPFMATP